MLTPNSAPLPVKRPKLRQKQHAVAHREQPALIAVSHCGVHVEREL